MMDISLQAKLTHTDGRLKIMKCIPWHMCERKRQGQILPFNYEDLVVIWNELCVTWFSKSTILQSQPFLLPYFKSKF